MKRYSSIDVGLLVLRVGFALLLVSLHGWNRLSQAFGYLFLGHTWTFPAFLGRLGLPYPLVFAVLSALAESVAATLVGVGIATRLAAAMVVINMSVAFFNEASKGDPFELPGLYLLIALTLVVAGPGALRLFARSRPGASSRPR